MGGKPNQGTPADKRLSVNKGKASSPIKAMTKNVGKSSVQMPGVPKKGK